MYTGNACHDNGRLSSFRPSETSPTNHSTALDPSNNWRYTREQTNLLQYNCIRDGATLKFEGTAFASSPKPRYPLHQLVAIANPDARRPTSIRYQYFFSSSPILSRACALSRFFFSSLHFTSFHFFCLSLFFFLILYGVYISLYMHFGVRELKRNYQWKESWT